mgnify:CR=1 FL=1
MVQEQWCESRAWCDGLRWAGDDGRPQQAAAIAQVSACAP